MSSLSESQKNLAAKFAVGFSLLGTTYIFYRFIQSRRTKVSGEEINLLKPITKELEFTKSRESDFEDDLEYKIVDKCYEPVKLCSLTEITPRPTEDDGIVRRQISYELDFTTDEKTDVNSPSQSKKGLEKSRSASSTRSVGTVDFTHEYFDGISDSSISILESSMYNKGKRDSSDDDDDDESSVTDSETGSSFVEDLKPTWFDEDHFGDFLASQSAKSFKKNWNELDDQDLVGCKQLCTLFELLIDDYCLQNLKPLPEPHESKPLCIQFSKSVLTFYETAYVSLEQFTSVMHSLNPSLNPKDGGKFDFSDFPNMSSDEEFNLDTLSEEFDEILATPEICHEYGSQEQKSGETKRRDSLEM